MNLRPPGYEPGELPGCSTPRRDDDCTIVRVLLIAAVVVSAVFTLGGLGYAVVRGISLWRSFKRFTRAAGPTLSRIGAATAQIEEQLQRARAAAARLQEATGRLQRSRAVLGTQTDALSSAVGRVRRLLWFVPGM